jgi:acetylornithine deacetylase
VLAHRGIGTASGRFSGRAGHASSAAALAESATHEAVRWAHAALDFASASEATTSNGLSGLRFNLGRIAGGQKPNVVAAEASVRFGVRPPPGIDPRAIVEALQGLAPSSERVRWEPGFFGPAFPTDPDGTRGSRALSLAERLGVRVAAPVDFWTEAALFSRAGYPAIVLGPGSISQAHSANEWVPLGQLTHVAAAYGRVLDAAR